VGGNLFFTVSSDKKVRVNAGSAECLRIRCPPAFISYGGRPSGTQLIMTDFLARLQAMGYTPQGPATTGRRQYTQRVHVNALLYVTDVLQVKDDRGAR